MYSVTEPADIETVIEKTEVTYPKFTHIAADSSRDRVRTPA
jgi:hypothetical protein